MLHSIWISDMFRPSDMRRLKVAENLLIDGILVNYLKMEYSFERFIHTTLFGYGI